MDQGDYLLLAMSRTQLGITLIAFGGLIAILGTYLYNTASSTNSAQRHQKVIDGQARTDEHVSNEVNRILKELHEIAEKRPDIISMLQENYPLGFAIYGYRNGQLSWIGFPSAGPVNVNTDWGKTIFDFDSVANHVHFHVYDIEYDSPSARAWISGLDVTGVPTSWRHHQENGLIGTPEGILKVGIDIFDEGGWVLYVIGFKLGSIDDINMPRPPRPPNRLFRMHEVRFESKG
jgi:hypothetical protein